MSWVKARISWWEASLPGRTLKRFGSRRGSVLAGGIAYYAVFSLFPALAIGFTVFGLIVGGSTELQEDLAEYINKAFGIDVIAVHPGDQGIVQMSALTSTASLSITGLVGLLLLLWAGLGWLSAMGAGVQVMFDITPRKNLAKKKAIDLVLLAVLGVSVLASVIGGIIVTSASEWMAAKLGLGDSSLASWGTTLVSLLIVVIINVGIFLLIFKLQARVRLSVADLWTAALIGAVGIVALQYFATFLVTQASSNQFLATFAAIIALLLWMNFAGRVILLSGAWGAEVAWGRGNLRSAAPVDVLEAGAASAVAEGETAPARGARTAAAPEPELVVDGSRPNFGQRSADRTTLAAGVVLGATVATGLHITRTLVRAVTPGRRGSGRRGPGRRGSRRRATSADTG